jgi:putative ABC transport system permease protein
MTRLVRLALADLRAEKTLALCTALAIAAVLAPLLVLAGLRAGVIAGLRARLLATPTARQIVSIGNREIPVVEVAALSRRRDVAFVVPRLRTLAMSLNAERADGRGGVARLELIPSGPGDPLLAAKGTGGGPRAARAVVLSAAAAARLHAHAGSRLRFVLVRIGADGVRLAQRIPVRVQGIAPADAFARPAAFIALALAAYAEDYQDGRAGPVTDGHLPPPRPRRFDAGFRLFARRLDQVPALVAALERQGFAVVSHGRAVASLLGLDRDLGLLLAFVAGLGGAGYLVALGASLWAAVERKRRPFAMLRFLGLSEASLATLPALEALMLGAVGAVLALAGAEAVALAIDRAFAAAWSGGPICRIGPAIAAEGLGATLAGAALAAAAAGWRLARIDPWEDMQ